MTTSSVIMTVELAVIALGIYLAVQAALERFSPRYVLKRKLKRQARQDRSLAKYRASKQQEQERLLQWSVEHPDDPVAQGYLQSITNRGSELSPGETEVFDPAAELRLSQKLDDEYERRHYERQARNQRMLDWAIDNPDTAEGYRHLTEMLDTIVKEIAQHDTLIDLQRIRLTHEYDEVEAIELTSQIAEGEARKRAQEETMRRIQQALATSPLNESA